MTRSCKNCGECARLYRKAWCEFVATRLYFCRLRENMTDLSGVCGDWRQVEPKYDLSSERFDLAEKDVIIIKNLTKMR